MMSLYHIQLQLSTHEHICITTSRGLSQKAQKEENVLQNILHLLKFIFWASFLSKPQRTTLVASKKCHTAVFQLAFKLLKLAFTCEQFSLCKLEVPERSRERSARTKFTFFFSFLGTKQQKQEHMVCFFTYKLNSCMFMYISCELHKSSLYKYKHKNRQFSPRKPSQSYMRKEHFPVTITSVKSQGKTTLISIKNRFNNSQTYDLTKPIA